MNPVGSFLGKLNKITPPDETLRKRTSEIIKIKFGLSLPIKDISVKNLVVYIKGSPAIKSEVFMSKSYILEKLKKEFGLKSPLDIR